MLIDKNVLSLLLAGGLAASVVACSDSDDPTTTPDSGMDAGMDGSGDGGSVEPDGDTTEGPDGDATEEPDGDATEEPDGDATEEPDGDGSSEPTLGNIVEVADEAGVFTTLLAALDTAELTDTLEGEGPFTVFAPTDEAFTAYLTEAGTTAEALLANPDLAQILLYHVISGAAVEAADVQAGPVTTAADLTAIATTEGGVAINGIAVETQDVQASNGVIHIIDGVLIPPTIAELATYAGDFGTLLAAVTQEGLAGTLADPEQELTVFAPNEAAFADLLAALEATPEQLLAREDLDTILLYHVLDGIVESTDVTTGFVTTLAELSLYADITDGVVLNDDSTVVAADLKAVNGVIHVVDSVLLPQNIAQLATLAGDFGTLLAAATATEVPESDLVVADLLTAVPETEDDLLTVFAPTDAAFTALLADLEITAEELLANEDLFLILAYHVLGAQVLSTDVAPGFVTSLANLSLAISAGGEGVGFKINQADIDAVDIVGTNGVIHVIDSVLLPADIVELATYSGSFSTLLTAAVEAELDGVLSAEVGDVESAAPFTVFAPTDDAFAELLADLEISAADLLALPNLADILLYHTIVGAEVLAEDVATGFVSMGLDELTAVLSPNEAGDGWLINDANIIVTDVIGTNGVIHAIDYVIFPSDIPTVLGFHPDFTTLVAALAQEELVDDLTISPTNPSSSPRFTVFAPTNAAFSAVGTVAEILAIAGLDNILLYHVASNTFFSSSLPSPLTMLNTNTAVISTSGGVTSIDGAPIQIVDLKVTNGVIHVLGGVMLPPSN